MELALTVFLFYVRGIPYFFDISSAIFLSFLSFFFLFLPFLDGWELLRESNSDEMILSDKKEESSQDCEEFSAFMSWMSSPSELIEVSKDDVTRSSFPSETELSV